SLENALESPASSGSPPPLAWPQKIMMAPARKFSILSMPSWRILEQSNPGGISGLMRWGLGAMLYFCRVRAALETGPGRAGNAPKPTSARKTPARAMERPIRTRKLKNADCEVDFFFMNGVGY